MNFLRKLFSKTKKKENQGKKKLKRKFTKKEIQKDEESMNWVTESII